VPPFGVVETFNVVEYVGFGVVPCPVCFVRRALGFERREEALHRRIIPAIARTAHRTGDAEIGHQPLELSGCALVAAVGVVQQSVWPSASPDRHHQRIGDKLCRHGGAHRP